MAHLTFETIPRIADVPAVEWDAVAGLDHPFVSHAFLALLEDSGSATQDTGWGACHLLARDEGRLVAAAPAYLKAHSMGEYVFDHPWADAYRRAGQRYYPKLLVGVPFTPVPGPRLLGPVEHRPALILALRSMATQNRLSSAHVNFIRPDEVEQFRAAGWLVRTGLQFHWDNRGYHTFDDFVAALTSRRRKELLRERRQVAASGVTVRARRGDEVSPEEWRRFYTLYRAQSDEKWGQAYLTEAFFEGLGPRLGERVVLVTAERDGQMIAGALNLAGADTLYGRNWGRSEDIPGLHFEVCYHQAVEWAIRHGLARVEAGAQGEHKLQRGYLPTPTYSAHWIADERFRGPIASWLERETLGVEQAIAAYAEHSPYRASE